MRQQTPPRLRAYGVGATTEYLVGRGLANDAGGRAQAVYLPENTPAAYASVLVPTIDYASINENEPYLELVGQFGRRRACSSPQQCVWAAARAPPARPCWRVPTAEMQGGESLSGPLWRGDLIQAPLRSGHLARGGYVQVVNGDRWSNLLQITFWEIPISVMSTISGGLTLQMTVTLTLRADVRGYRLQPDGERWAGAAMRVLASSANSRANFTASGEISRTVNRDTTTISWSGSGGVSSTPGDLPWSRAPACWTGRRGAGRPSSASTAAAVTRSARW